MGIWSVANSLGPSLGLMFACCLAYFSVACHHVETFLMLGNPLKWDRTQSPGPTMGQVSPRIDLLIVVQLFVPLTCMDTAIELVT